MKKVKHIFHIDYDFDDEESLCCSEFMSSIAINEDNGTIENFEMCRETELNQILLMWSTCKTWQKQSINRLAEWLQSWRAFRNSCGICNEIMAECAIDFNTALAILLKWYLAKNISDWKPSHYGSKTLAYALTTVDEKKLQKAENVLELWFSAGIPSK